MELDYPYFSEEQIKIIREQLIPKFNAKGINNFDKLEDAEADGLEWLEMFEDLDIEDLSHISNKQLGLKDDATQEDRDKVFEDEFGSGREWTMVTNLIWEWLETEDWEIKDTNIIDTEIIMPDWFNGKVYDKGDFVENPNGVEIELNSVELSLYKCFKDNRFAANMYIIDPSLLTESEFEEKKKKAFQIFIWFKENNNNAFNILIKG